MIAQPAEQVTFTAQPTASDYVSTSAALLRVSTGSQVLGGAMLGLGTVGLISFTDLFSVVPIAFGLALITGAFAVPFVWYGIRRRRDLLLAPLHVSADREGISITGPTSTARQQWSTYKRVREVPTAFLLDTGAGANLMIAKRGPDPEVIERFRSLLADVGLLRAVASAETRAAWILAGVGIGVGYHVLLRFVMR